MRRKLKKTRATTKKNIMHTQNIFVSILRELKVPFTNSFALLAYEEHPYKYTFYGLKSLCEKFGIETEGLLVYNKEEIQKLPVPFVAEYNNDYVLVKNVAKHRVVFEIYGVDNSMSIEQFQDNWSGHILLFSPNENSIEPDYRKHVAQNRINFIEQCVLSACVLILSGGLLIRRTTPDVLEIVLLLLYMCGCILSGMLILQQLKKNTPFLDSVCHSFKNSSCNNVLESNAAKFLKRYSWAEIGFGYFSVSLIALVVSSQTLNALAQIAVMAVPYSIWSIWYQHRISQWCPLCLMVQVVVILQFICCFGGGCYSLPIKLDTQIIMLLCVAYIATILTLNKVLPMFSFASELQKVRWQYSHMKMSKKVFDSLQQGEVKYEVDDSSIRFGNPKSNMIITVFSNPYCNPCAAMHKRLQALYTSNSCLIQYIFTSFKPEWNEINKYLIAVYQQYGAEKAWEVYTEWYDNGKYSQESFFDKFHLDMNSDDIEREFQRHEQWKRSTKFNATPTILVNGGKLPYGYNIEDVQYLS